MTSTKPMSQRRGLWYGFWIILAAAGAAGVILYNLDALLILVVQGLCLLGAVVPDIVRRRKGKGRGFAVEAGGGGPAPGIDPPPRRPDNIPPP